MIRLLEAIFRRFPLLLLILFIPIIVSLWVSLRGERPPYRALATLWAIQRYQIPSVTSQSYASTTPAEAQSTVLTEMLQSRAFDVAVGNSTNLKSTFNLRGSPSAQNLDDAYVSNISENVQVVATGDNSFQISYSNYSSKIAVEVVNAIIDKFHAQVKLYSIIEGQKYNIIEGQNILKSYQSQLNIAQKDVDTAINREVEYRAVNPGVDVNDPYYAQLDNQRVQALSRLANLQTNTAMLSQELAAAQNREFFKVLDPPAIRASVSSTAPLLMAGSVGTAIGLIVCVVYLLIIVRRDRALYTVCDVERIAPYPVLMQVPYFRKSTPTFSLPNSDINKSRVRVSSRCECTEKFSF